MMRAASASSRTASTIHVNVFRVKRPFYEERFVLATSFRTRVVAEPALQRTDNRSEPDTQYDEQIHDTPTASRRPVRAHGR